jgi:hypothetical protein
VAFRAELARWGGGGGGAAAALVELNVTVPGNTVATKVCLPAFLLRGYASGGDGDDEGGLKCSTSLDGVAAAAKLQSHAGLLCW